MKIKVIEIKKDGKVSYLRENTIFSEKNVVADPSKAFNYDGDDEKLQKDLNNLYVTNLGGAKSGVRADSADVVEFEFSLKEVSRTVGREAVNN